MEKIFDDVGVVVLAAGKSKRMKSKTNKLMTSFEGQPLIHRVYQACHKNSFRQIILVVGPDANDIQDSFKKMPVSFAIQHERLGTGHALMQAVPLIEPQSEHIVLVVGDHPFITADSLEYLVRAHKEQQAATTLLTAHYENPPAYGRIIRDNAGRIVKIVEEKDATPAEKKIDEVNISTYCFQAPTVLPLLHDLQANNAQQEYYLTDIIEILLQKGHRVQAIPYADNTIGIGINNRADLAYALKQARQKHQAELMQSGVTILDPESTYIDSTVQIGADTIIYPFSVIEKNTKIGSDCIIGPQVRISNSRIPDHKTIEFAVVENITLSGEISVKLFTQVKG